MVSKLPDQADVEEARRMAAELPEGPLRDTMLQRVTALQEVVDATTPPAGGDEPDEY